VKQLSDDMTKSLYDEDLKCGFSVDIERLG
jgi:hypothetical protein